MQDEEIHLSRRSLMTGTVAVAAGAAVLGSATLAAAGTDPETAGAATFRNDAAILLIDHQDMTVSWIKSQPQDMVIANTRMLARLGEEMNIPLLVTSTMEDTIGTNIKGVQETAPRAYAARVKRGGTLNCFLDPVFAAAVTALGRKSLILAGLTTDICLFHTAMGAIEAGYTVLVVADACGSMSAMADDVTFDRLRAAGAVVTVANQVLTELFTDFGTAEGQVAMNINLQEVVSKFAK